MPEKSIPRAKLVSLFRTVLLYCFIIVIGSVAGNVWMTRNQATGQAPHLSGPALDGRQVTIDYQVYDRPLLVYFFADWCPICKLQNSSVASIARDFPVVAVAMQSGDVDNVNQYVRSEGLDVPVINDESGIISQNFSVTGVPAVFIIDGQGAIRSSLRGYASEVGMKLRLWLIAREWL